MIAPFTLPVFGPALPEIILAAGALGLVLFGAFRGERSAELVTTAALALIAVTLLAVFLLPSVRTEALAGSFVVDGFAKFMKALTLIGAGAGIILSTDYLTREGINRFEFPVLIVLATVGMLMVISSNDLIALFSALDFSCLHPSSSRASTGTTRVRRKRA